MLVKISNRGSLPRLYLEIVGLSGKRDRMDDDAVIGQFGSGTKFASIAALRLGLATGFASTDDEGPYFLSIGSEPIALRNRVAARLLYKYQFPPSPGQVPKHYKRSNLAIEACLDWDKPIGADLVITFKIVREHICNARDEGAFRIEFVEKPTFAAEGETSVYLTFTEDQRPIYETPERYFKFLSDQKPLYQEAKRGEIWFKSEEGKTRLFILGVLVDCTADSSRSSLFDYSLCEKRLLSEERILKDQYSFMSGVGKMLCGISDVGFAEHVIASIVRGSASYEEDALSRAYAEWLTPESKIAWLEGAHCALGAKIALPSGNKTTDENVRQIYGYTILTELSHDLRTFLKLIGVPDAAAVMPNLSNEIRRVDFATLPPYEQAKFRRAFRMFSACFPRYAVFPILITQSLSEGADKLAGLAGTSRDSQYKQICLMVNRELRLPSQDEVFKTLFHEGRHCFRKAGDYERAFIDQADDDIADLAYREAGVIRHADGRRVPALAPPREPIFVPIPEEVIDITEDESVIVEVHSLNDPTLEELDRILDKVLGKPKS